MNCKLERLVRCGACNAKFATARELVKHLKTCQFARVGTAMLEEAIAAGLEPNVETPNAQSQRQTEAAEKGSE